MYIKDSSFIWLSYFAMYFPDENGTKMFGGKRKSVLAAVLRYLILLPTENFFKAKQLRIRRQASNQAKLAVIAAAHAR